LLSQFIEKIFCPSRMEASVGAIEFFFAAVVVGVTHSSETESAAVARATPESECCDATITALRENVREILNDLLQVNLRLPTARR
jgi:hypothetical protein